MQKELEEKLQQFKKKTISIDELEILLPSHLSYEQFATIVIALEDVGTLQMIKARGRNSRQPSLAYHYRINIHALRQTHFQHLQEQRFLLHNAINLDIYFASSREVWENDQPFIEQINRYIVEQGLPTEYAAAPERSFQLVGDEKWLDEKGGKGLLQRTQLWNKLKIIPVSDPLMFALNPTQLTLPEQSHIIVENKTTYHALLPKLNTSKIATLIYGAGKQIEKSIENFHLQYPLAEVDHTFLYFGDIDYDGIAIWDRLSKKITVKPAVAFYTTCLQKEPVRGKTNQTKYKEAVDHFLTYFLTLEQQKISDTLANGAYYPQEILTTNELQNILLQID